ncbi:MAG: hypothetical protein HWE21_11720 [Cytophagia bacterium]|nr:hypothetical protein [Cytophagia bacterium]
MRFFSWVLMVLVANSLQSSKIPKELIGEWKEFKQRTVSGDSLNWVGEMFEPFYHIALQENGEGLDFTTEGMKFRYKLLNDTLYMGNRKYVMDSLSEGTLVLRVWDSFSPSEDDKVHFFNKIIK